MFQKNKYLYPKRERRNIANYKRLLNVIKQRLVLSDYSSFAFQLEISKEALKKLKEIFLNIKSA